MALRVKLGKGGSAQHEMMLGPEKEEENDEENEEVSAASGLVGGSDESVGNKRDVEAEEPAVEGVIGQDENDGKEVDCLRISSIDGCPVVVIADGVEVDVEEEGIVDVEEEGIVDDGKGVEGVDDDDEIVVEGRDKKGGSIEDSMEESYAR